MWSSRRSSSSCTAVYTCGRRPPSPRPPPLRDRVPGPECYRRLFVRHNDVHRPGRPRPVPACHRGLRGPRPGGDALECLSLDGCDGWAKGDRSDQDGVCCAVRLASLQRLGASTGATRRSKDRCVPRDKILERPSAHVAMARFLLARILRGELDANERSIVWFLGHVVPRVGTTSRGVLSDELGSLGKVFALPWPHGECGTAEPERSATSPLNLDKPRSLSAGP